MKTGSAGRSLIKASESLELKAYRDPGTGGEPITIGWGTTGTVTRDDGSIVKIHLGMECTEAEADRWFEERLEQFEGWVNSLIKVPVTQEQFDAVMSLTYNIGPDIDDDTIAEGLGDSTLLKKLNAGDYLGAADEFPKWSRAGGHVMGGLVTRRKKERQLFLSGTYNQ